MSEYLAKKESGVRADEIYDDDGQPAAYYEPFSELQQCLVLLIGAVLILKQGASVEKTKQMTDETYAEENSAALFVSNDTQ